MVRKIWASDFHKAYEKSLKVKPKIVKSERKWIDVKQSEKNAKAAYLYRWLIDNKYIIPNMYRVFMRCGSCGNSFPVKKWEGTVMGDPKKSFKFVCSKCVTGVKKKSKNDGGRKMKMKMKEGLR